MIIDNIEKLRAYRETQNNTRGLVKITSDIIDVNVLSLPKDIAKEVADWDAVDFEDKVNGHIVSFRKQAGSRGEVIKVVEVHLQEAKNVIIEFPDDFEYYIVRMKDLSDFTDANLESLWKLNPILLEITGSVESDIPKFHLINRIQKKLIDGDEVNWKRLRHFIVTVSPNSYQALDLELLINGLYAAAEDDRLNYLLLLCKSLANDEIKEIAEKPIRPTWKCIPELVAKHVLCTPVGNAIRRRGGSSNDSDFAVTL